jgi:hypothetical protein
MANLCSNHLIAEGGNVDGLHDMMESARKYTLDKHEGWTRHDDNYLFDIHREGDQWNFETKWSPPLDEVIGICRELGVSVTMDYVELGMNIYGRIMYDHMTDVVRDIYLDDSDFNRVEYDEDNDIYTFDGKQYDSEYDALELMLDAKWKGGEL